MENFLVINFKGVQKLFCTTFLLWWYHISICWNIWVMVYCHSITWNYHVEEHRYFLCRRGPPYILGCLLAHSGCRNYYLGHNQNNLSSQHFFLWRYHLKQWKISMFSHLSYLRGLPLEDRVFPDYYRVKWVILWGMPFYLST